MCASTAGTTLAFEGSARHACNLAAALWDRPAKRAIAVAPDVAVKVCPRSNLCRGVPWDEAYRRSLSICLAPASDYSISSQEHLSLPLASFAAFSTSCAIALKGRRHARVDRAASTRLLDPAA